MARGSYKGYGTRECLLSRELMQEDARIPTYMEMTFLRTLHDRNRLDGGGRQTDRGEI